MTSLVFNVMSWLSSRKWNTASLQPDIHFHIKFGPWHSISEFRHTSCIVSLLIMLLIIISYIYWWHLKRMTPSQLLLITRTQLNVFKNVLFHDVTFSLFVAGVNSNHCEFLIWFNFHCSPFIPGRKRMHLLLRVSRLHLVWSFCYILASSLFDICSIR